MKIKKANKGDIEALAKLLHKYDLYEHSTDNLIKVSSEKEYRKEIRDVFKNKSAIFIIAEENGKLIGFVNYSIDNRGNLKIGVLQDIFIEGDYRGKRIGKKLADYVINIMKKQKCKFVKSAVRVKNKNAQKFWQSLGFKINFKPREYSMRKAL